MAPSARKLQAFDDDDIIRYSMAPEVPIVGLVRDRGEYREMREIALIYGTVLGLPKKRAAAEPAAVDAAPAAPPVAAVEAPTAAATVAPKPEPPVA